MTDHLPVDQPQSTTASSPGGARHWWGRGAAMATAALLLVGAGAGVGMAVTGDNPSPAPTAATTTTIAPVGGARAPGTHAATPGRGQGQGAGKVDPARQAWAHQYGVDRATMAKLAPVAAASPEQQAGARDLLLRTEAATAQYNDLATAKAAGFDLQASLA